MRRLLIRSVLSALALAIVAVAWIIADPWWARALGAIHTTRLATATSISIRKYSGFSTYFRPGAIEDHGCNTVFLTGSAGKPKFHGEERAGCCATRP
jgi:hypothetical protein